METFWFYVGVVYRVPLYIWDKAIELEYWFGFVIAVVVALFIWGGTAAIIYYSTRGIYRKWVWYRTREHCQHCGDWTTDKFTGSFDSCQTQKACCWGCNLKHLADSETVYECPVDGTKMTKVINELGVIIDECGKCRGVWLTSAEIDAIIENAEDDARASGMLTGMVIGSAA